MKRTLQLLAALVLVAGLGLWLATGANRGWTKTSVPTKSVDEITGIEAITYEKRFVPGVDFLGATLLGAAALAGASFLFRKTSVQTQTPRPKPTMNPTKTFLTLATLAQFTFGASAATQSFDFKDPKGVNNAVFKLDAPLEAINGSANGISGTVTFDPANPAATKGKIVVATSSLQVPNPVMKEHMLGDQWMDVAKYPEITFEAKSLKNVKTAGDATAADVTGTLTVRGVAKEVTVPVKFTYLKDKLGLRVPNQKGDLLVLRASFIIKRSDFGINPKAPEDKVADTIDLTLSIAGASPQK